MLSITSTYDQTQLRSPCSSLQVQATGNRTDRCKRYSAIICGFLQICTGLMAFTVGVIEAATPMLMIGITAHVGLIVTVLAGAFGIQYGRTGGKCPAIASMVLSILSSINYGVAFPLYFADMFAITSYARGNEVMDDVNRSAALLIPITTIQSCAGLVIFSSMLNVIACIVQSACACGIVCPCCKPTNTNAYIMADQEFLQPV